ncbi:MAG: cytochrome c, partial [Candidatus Hydrogenedentes bacterium]|nr:cytochrome c [Candidatus Hydrogenedentota bacterium]
PKGWRVLQDQGMAAAEVAVLTMMREGEHEATPEWDQLAEAMKKAGMALSDAAAKKDFPAVQAQVTAIIQSCNTCHQKFEPETAPEILP